MRRWASRLFLLCAALALAGCSGVRLIYDNADTFIRWRMLQFLDVHGEQADELDERIARFMRWHRASALPKYASDAEEGAKRLSRGPFGTWTHDGLESRKMCCRSFGTGSFVSIADANG